MDFTIKKLYGIMLIILIFVIGCDEGSNMIDDISIIQSIDHIPYVRAPHLDITLNIPEELQYGQHSIELGRTSGVLVHDEYRKKRITTSSKIATNDDAIFVSSHDGEEIYVFNWNGNKTRTINRPRTSNSNYIIIDQIQQLAVDDKFLYFHIWTWDATNFFDIRAYEKINIEDGSHTVIFKKLRMRFDVSELERPRFPLFSINGDFYTGYWHYIEDKLTFFKIDPDTWIPTDEFFELNIGDSELLEENKDQLCFMHFHNDLGYPPIPCPFGPDRFHDDIIDFVNQNQKYYRRSRFDGRYLLIGTHFNILHLYDMTQEALLIPEMTIIGEINDSLVGVTNNKVWMQMRNGNKLYPNGTMIVKLHCYSK